MEVLRLLAVCFSLEILQGLRETIKPKGEWDETRVWHAREEKQTADSSHVF